jgi:Holliday junction resolvase RuvA-like protein/HNH endonuclease
MQHGTKRYRVREIGRRVRFACHKQANGELVSVGAELIAMAHCDGQHVGHIPSRTANQNSVLGGTADVHLDDANVHAASAPSAKAHTENAHVDAGAQGDTTPASAPARAARAKQTIPPAMRRAVLLRDQHRCRVPGCRNATFVDLHHVELRSEGGRNELGNLITLCGSHHRAAHRGALIIEKDAALGLRFRHADGAVYGSVHQPRTLDLQTRLFSALRYLGFKEREVRAVLAELRANADLEGASLQVLLRKALCRLSPPEPKA